MLIDGGIATERSKENLSRINDRKVETNGVPFVFCLVVTSIVDLHLRSMDSRSLFFQTHALQVTVHHPPPSRVADTSRRVDCNNRRRRRQRFDRQHKHWVIIAAQSKCIHYSIHRLVWKFCQIGTITDSANKFWFFNVFDLLLSFFQHVGRGISHQHSVHGRGRIVCCKQYEKKVLEHCKDVCKMMFGRTYIVRWWIVKSRKFP